MLESYVGTQSGKDRVEMDWYTYTPSLAGEWVGGDDQVLGMAGKGTIAKWSLKTSLCGDCGV